ncbi:MAG: hypothetical protein ABL890_02335 [Candidatus Peribacteraceae bacterium]
MKQFDLSQALTQKEKLILSKLRTPRAIQDFLDTIPMNHEPEGDTCLSPRRVLREKRAHCIEGAMLAALALRLQGRPPLLLDLKSTKHDYDHVVTLFKEGGCFGAISKTNHGVLRYREPIYKNVRELVMSYFHEYFLNDSGKKTLRSYSVPVDLSELDHLDWITSEENVWEIPMALENARHFPILTPNQIKNLRPADLVEREMGKVKEWKE